MRAIMVLSWPPRFSNNDNSHQRTPIWISFLLAAILRLQADHMSTHHGEFHAIGQRDTCIAHRFDAIRALCSAHRYSWPSVVCYIILYTHSNCVVLSNNEHVYVCTAASFELLCCGFWKGQMTNLTCRNSLQKYKPSHWAFRVCLPRLPAEATMHL